MMEHAVLAILLASFGARACDMDRYNQCAATFFNKYPASRNDFIPDFKNVSMDNVCSDFHKLTGCAELSMAGCSKPNQIVWKISKNTLNYMCSDSSKQRLEIIAVCIYGADITKSFESCNKTMQNTMAAIGRLSSASSSEFCSAMRKFKTCSVSSAYTYCGSDVSKWVDGFVDTALEPANKVANCMYAMNLMLIIGVSAGVILALGIIGGFVWLALQNRKNEDKSYAAVTVTD